MVKQLESKAEDLFPQRETNKGAIKIATKIQEGGVYKVVHGKLVLVKEPPKVSSVKLRPGVEYITTAGYKARIWVINKDSIEWPILGGVEVDGEWQPRVWNIDGVVKRPYSAKYDLVAEWSET